MNAYLTPLLTSHAFNTQILGVCCLLGTELGLRGPDTKTRLDFHCKDHVNAYKVKPLATSTALGKVKKPVWSEGGSERILYKNEKKKKVKMGLVANLPESGLPVATSFLDLTWTPRTSEALWPTVSLKPLLKNQWNVTHFKHYARLRTKFCTDHELIQR